MAVTAELAREQTTRYGQLRTLTWLGLVTCELILVSLLFANTAAVDRYSNPVFYVVGLSRWLAVAGAAFAFLLWPERAAFAREWSAVQATHDWRRPLAINLVLSALLAIATAMAARTSDLTFGWLGLYALLLTAGVVSMAAIDVPLRAFLSIASRYRRAALISGAAGLAITTLAEAAVVLVWPRLSGATLGLAGWMLGLYESEVAIDTVERTIRVGNFVARIHYQCSGIEGLAMVAGFVTLYLYAFRARLRFPSAFLLYPAGLGAIWVINAARIAALTSIGAHVSPLVASKGFHSQAGWMTFLLVTLGLMTVAGRWLGAAPHATSPAADAPRDDGIGAESLLVPFVALMIGSIVMAAAAPFDQPLYALKVAFVLAALWAYRRSYRGLVGSPSALPVLAGLAVGAAWIGTEPAPDLASPVAAWLGRIGPGAAAIAWLAVRGVGAIVLVPFVEEMAFRGYVYRRITASDCDFARAPQWSWLALAVSSVLFGLLHDRWLAGALSGALFAVLMLRRGRIGDAIWAHAAANALIFCWAIVLRQWSLL